MGSPSAARPPWARDLNIVRARAWLLALLLRRFAEGRGGPGSVVYAARRLADATPWAVGALERAARADRTARLNAMQAGTWGDAE